MIPEDFKGRGYNCGFHYKQILKNRNKYMYQVSSGATGTIFFHVFKGEKYPKNNIEAIFSYEEAISKFKKL